MNVANPKLTWQLSLEGSWPTAVTFLGGSRKIAAANQEGQIYVWDLPETPPDYVAGSQPCVIERAAPDHPPCRRLDGHTNSVTGLVARPDGRELVSAGFDGQLCFWDPEAPATGTADVVLNAESRKIAAQRSGDQALVTAPGLSVPTVGPSASVRSHDDWILTLGASRDGSRLITGDVASRVVLWDVSQRRELARWSGYAWNWIVAAALSSDGQTALVSEYRYKRDDFDIPAPAVRLYGPDATPGLDLLGAQFSEYKPLETGYGAAQVWGAFVAHGLIAADFSPDGTLIALGQGGETEKGTVHLVEAATGKLVRDVSGHQSGVCAVRFSADGRYLLSTGRDTTLRICQVSDGTEVCALGQGRGGQFQDWFSSLAISPDEAWLAATDIAGFVHVWRLE